MLQASPSPPPQADVLRSPSRKRSGLNAARLVAGVAGAVLCTVWWLYAPRLSHEHSFLLWAAAVLAWALAFFSTWTVPRWSRATTWAVLLIALAVLPRTSSLTQAPYMVTLDESIHPLYGEEALHKQPWDLAGGVSWYFSTPLITQALQAWPCLLLDPLLGARLATVILAVLSLWATYALGVHLFSRWAGLLSLVVLGGSYWHMTYSRMAYPYMQPIVALPLTLHVLLLGVERRHRFLQFLGGMLLGLSVLLYTPARIVIPIFALWYLHRLMSQALQWREALRIAAVVALGGALVLSPYLRTQGVRGVLSRYSETTMNPNGTLHLLGEYGWTSHAGRELLAKQVQAAAGVYYAPGAWMAVRDFSPAPLLDPVSLAAALAGLLLAVLCWRNAARFLLVLWILPTFLAGQVLTDIPISAYRAAPLLPALALCVGLCGATLTALVTRRVPRYATTVNVALLIAFAIASVPANVRALQRYLASRARADWVSMARFIAAGTPEPVYYVVSSRSLVRSEVFRFLGRGREMRDVPSLIDALGRTIDPSRPAMFVIDPPMTEAATAIRRCYPGAMPWSGPYSAGSQPLLALYVGVEALAAGRDCAMPDNGSGLRARYFRGPQWDEEVAMERLEDWPIRWMTQDDTAQFRSVEWTGSVWVPVAGPYRFHLLAEAAEGSADVGEHLRVGMDGTPVQLNAGVYRLRVRCTAKPGSLCWLRWAPPGSDFQIIPPEFLRPASN